jgi:hypothetical protein
MSPRGENNGAAPEVLRRTDSAFRADGTILS